MLPFLDTAERAICRAEVVCSEPSSSRVVVQREGEFGAEEIPAIVALPIPIRLSRGDEVLVANGGEESFVIGVVSSSELETQRAAQKPESIQRGGAYAALEGEEIRVYSRRDELLFAYDPKAETARLHVAVGDLELSAARDIRLEAGRAVRVGARNVELSSLEGVRCRVAAAAGALRSVFGVSSRGVQIEGEALDVRSSHANVNIDEQRYRGRRVDADVGMVRVVAKKTEHVVRTIIEKAVAVYRSAEDLTQTKTGRLKTLVRETFHLRSRRTRMKSEKDVKIDGEQIHLG